MPTVKIYSTPTCPYCKQEKEYLKEKGIPFEDINVAEDMEKAEEMVHLSGQMGVPVTLIEDDDERSVVVGFNRHRIDELLGL